MELLHDLGIAFLVLSLPAFGLLHQYENEGKVTDIQLAFGKLRGQAKSCIR